MGKNLGLLLGVIGAIAAFAVGIFLFQPKSAPIQLAPSTPAKDAAAKDKDSKDGEKPSKPPDETPPKRGPSPGPRSDARGESQQVDGVRVRVLSANISHNFEGSPLYVRTDAPMLKVKLKYECVEPKPESKWKIDAKAAARIACFDDRGNEYRAITWDYAPTYYLRGGSSVDGTLYFNPPLLKPKYLDLDYPAPFLSPGNMYRFRIPIDMVEYPK